MGRAILKRYNAEGPDALRDGRRDNGSDPLLSPEQRAELDLQINLLSEYELTRVLKLVDAIADHLGLEEGRDPELDELKRDEEPRVMLLMRLPCTRTSAE